MKIRFFLLISLLATINIVHAQKMVTSEPKYFYIKHSHIPPSLELVEGSLQFKDADGNNIINAGETSHITMSIRNGGPGIASDCKLTIVGEGATQGITYASFPLSTILVDDTCKIDIPITASDSTVNGEVKFTIEVEEPNGFGINPIQLAITTHRFATPFVEVADYSITSSASSGKLLKKTPFSLQLILQNTDLATANDVKMEIKLPENMFLLDGDLIQQFATLQPNEQKTISLELQTNAAIQDELKLNVALSESTGKYAKNAEIPLRFGQVAKKSPTTITIAGQETTNTTPIASRPSALAISAISTTTPFEVQAASSVLAIYKNEFGKYEMPEKDETFPYTVFRVRLQGAPNLVRLAKQTLMLNLGQMFQTEQTVTSYNNMILFLIPSGAKNVYLTCGDGCEQQLIYSGRLSANKIYDGVIEVQ